jgi:hypothetical protein
VTPVTGILSYIQAQTVGNQDVIRLKPKGHVLRRKTCPFTMQEAIFHKTKDGFLFLADYSPVRLLELFG